MGLINLFLLPQKLKKNNLTVNWALQSTKNIEEKNYVPGVKNYSERSKIVLMWAIFVKSVNISFELSTDKEN